MQTFKILLNRSYTSSTASQTNQQLENDYYMYQTTNGGGIVNFSNVRGFLNDSKNQQIINDFFAYLTGSTTSDQTINIVSSDQKLSDVFNDYYQRLTKSAKTISQNNTFEVSLPGSTRSDVASPSPTSNAQSFSISIVNSDNPSQTNSNGGLTFGNTADSVSSSPSVSSTDVRGSTANSSLDNSDALPPVQIPKYSMTAIISKNLASGFRTVEKIFYHDWSGNASAIKTGMSAMTLSILGGTLRTRNRNVWVDTTSEESYYVPVYLQRGTNQISKVTYLPDLVIIPKKSIANYPEYSGITDITPPTSTSTKIDTIIGAFVDLNLETDETTFYTSL